MTAEGGIWTVAEASTISLRTSRIGLVGLHAHAPVVDGTARIGDGDVSLEFIVAIDRVSTGNPLLDPEVHALVHSGSDGRLVFSGSGANLAAVSGHARAGNITVPLELDATPDTQGEQPQEKTPMQLSVKGTAEFRDIHVPLPGMGHIRHVEIDITGLITLMRATAEA